VKLKPEPLVTEKSAAAPEELATMESRAPSASVTTEAVTPRLAALMALARSFRLSPEVPDPVLKVCEEPEAVLIVNEEVGKAEVALDSRAEYQDPVVARLFTVTVWIPAAVPAAAVAVTSLPEEVTLLAARGPSRVFRDCRSLDTDVVAFSIWVRAEDSLLRVV
jgi:hypothetical protein